MTCYFCWVAVTVKVPTDMLMTTPPRYISNLLDTRGDNLQAQVVVVFRGQNEDTQTREVGLNKYITIYRIQVLYNRYCQAAWSLSVFVARPTNRMSVAQGLF